MKATSWNMRALTYLSVSVSLFILFLFLRDSTWQGSADLHTLMEAIATLLALIIGVMALIRYYTKKSNIFLLIGAGFLGTSLLDGYHAVVTSAPFEGIYPSELSSLIPWSWIASRIFLSILMFASWLVWRYEKTRGVTSLINERAVYLIVGTMTLASFFFFAYVPLPRAYYPEFVFHRPEEFVPAFFFLFALIGYLKKGKWRTNYFEHWLVLSLLVGFMGQAMFMSTSSHLFDAMFDSAHLLKKASYICALTGLLISMYLLFRRVEESAQELERVGEGLRVKIEEQHRADAGLRQMAGIVATSNDAITVQDIEGNITAWNKGAEQMYGWKEAEALRMNIREIIPKDAHEELSALVKKLTERERITSIETQRLTKDGRLLDVWLTITALKDQEGNLEWISTTERDITERNRRERELHRLTEGLEKRARELTDSRIAALNMMEDAEQARQAAEKAEREIQALNLELEQRVFNRTAELEAAVKELEAFSYSVSHDLRAPLRSMDGFARILNDDFSPKLPEEGQRYLRKVRESAQKMGFLIDDLLAFSHLSRSDIKVRKVAPKPIVYQAIKELEAELVDRDVEFTIGELCECRSDPVMLRQVFVNLLQNAIKFTRGREPGVIEVGCRSENNPEDTCVYFVKDNGVGFDMRYVDKLFGVFQRLHRAEDYEGTGVGLATVERIIHRHGGKIWAESQVDKGTTIYFTVPSKEVEELV